MKKKYGVGLLIIVVLLSAAMPAFAHPDQNLHYKDLERVLFGKEILTKQQRASTSSLGDPAWDALISLEHATAIVLDQYKGDDQGLLDQLNEYGVPNLPPDAITTKEQHERGINFTAAAKDHRSFTHRGWTFSYLPSSSIANFPVRKEILMATAQVAFDPELLNDKRREAFCALLYYVHVLGDHMADSKAKGKALIVSLVEPGAAERTPPQNEDLFLEFKYYLSVLFSDKSEDQTYSRMMQKLNELRNKASKTARETNLFTKEGSMDLYHGYVDELFDILCTYVPHLLEREPFFNSVFLN